VTQKLALKCARHPWRTVAAWIGAIVVALVLVSTLLGGNLTSEGEVTNNPESLQANDLESEGFSQRQSLDEVVIVRSDTLRVSDEQFRMKVMLLAAALRDTGAT
jgi:uncharacterized membrane protein YdfJ with MMPL/SSD domain